MWGHPIFRVPPHAHAHTLVFCSVMLASVKLSLISLSTAVVVATIKGGVTASSAPVFTVIQGDQILTGAPGSYPSGSCTLGFNAEGFS